MTISISKSKKTLLYGVVTLGSIILIYFIKNGNKKKEGLRNAYFRQRMKREKLEKKLRPQNKHGFFSIIRDIF